MSEDYSKNTLWVRLSSSPRDWPQAENDRLLRVHSVQPCGDRPLNCSCCGNQAQHEFRLYDHKKGLIGGQTIVFLCRVHASIYMSWTQSEADRRATGWNEGWEVACDSCGGWCETKPRVRRYNNIGDYVSQGEPTQMICEECYDMETLFA